MVKAARAVTYIIIVFSVALVAFVAAKSSITSFTHDEAYTYTHYVMASFNDVVSYLDPYTNNHILNSLMMQLLEPIFGSSELALRLHSLLAMVGYLWVSILLLKDLPVKMRIGAFLLLIANPYLLDFFGLARGYGMSICFMMCSMYYTTRWLKSGKLVNIAMLNFCALLAAYSNFSMINFYLSLFAGINLLLILKVRENRAKGTATLYLWLKVNAINILFMFLTALIIWEPIRKISKQHLLDFGGKSGVVSDTIFSVISASFYHLPVPVVLLTLLSWCVFLAIVVVFVGSIIHIFSAKGVSYTGYIVVFSSFVLMSILVITIAQYYILKNDYFIGRFALFLFPLFMLSFVFALQLLYAKWGKPAIATISVNVLGIFCLLNLAYNINMSSYLDWEYDKDTRTVMTQLQIHHQQHNTGNNIRIGIYWAYEPAINYYRVTRRLTWLQQADRQDLMPTDNYYYANKAEIDKISPLALLVIATYSTGAVLIYNRPGK